MATGYMYKSLFKKLLCPGCIFISVSTIFCAKETGSLALYSLVTLLARAILEECF